MEETLGTPRRHEAGEGTVYISTESGWDGEL